MIDPPFDALTVLAAGGPENLFTGVKPSWGPFGELGGQAKVLLGALQAVALFACVAYTIWGASQQRLGSATHNSQAAEKGKAQFVSGLIGCAVVGSALTLTGLAYSVGLG